MKWQKNYRNKSKDELEKHEEIYQKFHKQEFKKKWFNFDRLVNFFGDMNFWMILGKKGIGKTYFLIELMKSIDKKNNEDMITYVRLTKKEADSVRDEWRSNPQLYPFKIKGSLIYSKKYRTHNPTCIKPATCTCPFQIKGDIVFATDLSASRGTQNPNLKWILYDEFINETGSYKFRDSLAKQFINFSSNKIRHKEEGVVRTVMFGNNNSMNNPYLQHFNINEYTNLWFDKKKKQLFINLRDLYSRATKQIRDLASHNIDILAYIDKNENWDLATKIINPVEIERFKPYINFIIDGLPMILYVIEDVKKRRLYALNIEDKSFVDRFNKKFLVYEESENFDFNNIIMIDKTNWHIIIKTICQLVKAEKLFFFHTDQKDAFKKIYPTLKKIIN